MWNRDHLKEFEKMKREEEDRDYYEWARNRARVDKGTWVDKVLSWALFGLFIGILVSMSYVIVLGAQIKAAL